MRLRTNTSFAALNEEEENLILCYRRSNDIGRQQLIAFAELFASQAEPLPDNVVPFPR